MSNPLTVTPPTLTPTLGSVSTAPPTTPPPTPTPTPTTTSTSTTPTSTSSSSSATSSTTSSSSTTQSTSSTLSSTSSTQTSSSTSTTATTATTPTTIATTSTTPTLTASSYTSTSDGVVVTSFTYVTASPTPTSNDNAATSTSSFFSNTGAVAGVFTVVGLVVVAIFVALVTNAVRRRRAQKFDRDVAEAAAEAAASSRSPFDDYTYNGSSGGGGGGGYPYSDTTHGTFAQAPMGLPTDTYGMGEMTQYDPYAAGAVSLATANAGGGRSRQDSETQRTPGIAGVGAGNLAREPSRRTPYHAFAGPGPQPPQTSDHTLSGRYRPRGVELLEGAGLADTGVAAMTAANNGAYINRRPSQYTQQTHGSMRSHGHSQGHSSSENYPMPLQPVYQSPPRNDTQFADAYTGFVNAPSQPLLGPGLPNPHDTSPSPPPAQSHSPVGEVEGEDDDEDYGQQNRVLRVANE
ncbi:hypothetical protein F4604DRAFT_180668 [Suillus subluteus]|nr:hypothetical protein F4604DRAFT_180668 [Suillus subluteus]